MDSDTLFTTICVINILLCVFNWFFLNRLERFTKLQKLADAKVETFYVRLAFVHKVKDGKWSSSCQYWKESDIVNKAKDLGVSVADYLASEYKYYRFQDIKPVEACMYKDYNLPNRFIIKGETLKKNVTVELSNENCYATVNRRADDEPMMCYWLGIIVTSDTPEYICEIKKEFRKKNKEKKQ